jgi:hypothetical protein
MNCLNAKDKNRSGRPFNGAIEKSPNRLNENLEFC